MEAGSPGNCDHLDGFDADSRSSDDDDDDGTAADALCLRDRSLSLVDTRFSAWHSKLSSNHAKDLGGT